MVAPIYNDFRALAELRTDAKAEDPKALREAAKQFESLFTRMLLKSMRETSFGDSLFGSDQTEFYQGMFDDQLAMNLAQGKGLGLADMLVRQLQQGGAAPVAPAEPALSVTSALSLKSASKTNTASSKAEFVNDHLPYATAAAQELGVDPSLLLAQAALETGWGQSVPCDAAGRCSNNMFGIKASGRWEGESVTAATTEYEQGNAVGRNERFRSYDSPLESFRDYARLIQGSPRYVAALNAGEDVRTFASALQRGGYATDPSYVDKLVAVASEMRNTVSALKLDDLRTLQQLDTARR